MASKRRVYGLIGYPVKHSLSPVMHNAAFKALGIDAHYELFEVKPQDLNSFLDSLDDREIDGLNVTIPHKIRTREILEKKFPFDWDVKEINKYLHYVKLSGAINTIKRNGDRLDSWNTDAEGFSESLEEDLKFKTKDKNVLLLGCGGAARAIIASLSWRNTKIKKIFINDISDIALNSAKEYFLQASEYLKHFSVENLEFISSKKIPEVINVCQLLVNATPVGMKEDDPVVIDKELFHKDLSVYDIVYCRNRKTKLIEDAESRNLPCVNGLRMLLHQGMLSFEIWTNKKAPQEVMWKALSFQISTK
ncbi:shikimate dehydrogenase family protein [Candidatus Omnitrophota bacterium]